MITTIELWTTTIELHAEGVVRQTALAVYLDPELDALQVFTGQETHEAIALASLALRQRYGESVQIELFEDEDEDEELWTTE